MGTGGRWPPACQDDPATPCARRRGRRLVARASVRDILSVRNGKLIRFILKILLFNLQILHSQTPVNLILIPYNIL